MLVAFSVTPLGVGDSVAEFVADAVRVVRDSGLPNQTDAMFTTIEGEWDEVMAVVKAAVDAVAARAPRVSVTLKADIRPGVTGALDGEDGGAGELPGLLNPGRAGRESGGVRSGLPRGVRGRVLGGRDGGEQAGQAWPCLAGRPGGR